MSILTPDGEVTQVRIATTWERFREVPGHELIVADPGFAPMYGMRTRRLKTDPRDARALAETCRSGTYRLAHRRSEPQRRVTTKLVAREGWCGVGRATSRRCGRC